MSFDINLSVKQATRNAIEKLEAENSFKQVDEMDRLLGLASEDPLKNILSNLFEKHVLVFGEAIAFKGGNTQTSGSIVNIMTKYCYYLGKNILANYKDSDETRLASLFEYVTPFAIKIIVAMETDGNPRSASSEESMLAQCIDRFCGEFNTK